MPWIESHSILIDHKKVREVAKILHISPVLMLGHLHCFWHKVIELREDGDITSWDVDDITYYAKWEGDSQQFYDALKSRFIDEKNDLKLVHDWLDYAGKYLYLKYHTNNPKLLKRIRLKYKKSGYFLGSPKGQPLGNPKGQLPNQPNQPNLTNILAQSNTLLSSFPETIKILIEEYIELSKNENKTKVITTQKRFRLINELYLIYQQSDRGRFEEALKITVNNEAPNINYLKKVYKGQEKRQRVYKKLDQQKQQEGFEEGHRKGEQRIKDTQERIKGYEPAT